MSRPRTFIRSSLVGILSLAVAAPASATPAPQSQAAAPAVRAIVRMPPIAVFSFMAKDSSPSRQASPTAARRSPASDPEGHVGAANDAARI